MNELKAAATIAHKYHLSDGKTITQAVDIAHDIAGLIGQAQARNVTNEILNFIQEVANSTTIASIAPQFTDRATQLLKAVEIKEP